MPKISASSLGDEAAMDSTFCRPPASSISTSIPIRRSSFSLPSSWVSRRSTNCTSAARMALVSMMVSIFLPAPSTTSMTSSKHQEVVTSLMRTQRVFLPQSSPFRASTMVLRAPALAEGATASSRSRKTWSASLDAALAIIFSLTPGTESCERRRRLGRGEFRLIQELGRAQRRAKGAEEGVPRAGQGDETVGRRIDAEGQQEGVVVALRSRNLMAEGILVHDPLADAEHRIDHGHVEELALPRRARMQHRADDAQRRIERRHGVADAWPDLDRLAAGQAGDPHHAAHGLGDHVIGRPVEVRTVAGARVAEAADGGIDQLRMQRRQGLVGQAQPVHHPDAEVFDDDVELRDQRLDQLDPFRGFQVDAQALLAAVDRLEIAGIAVLGIGLVEGTGVARQVAAVQALDLDHLGAQVGEVLGAEGPGQRLGEVQDLQAGQGPGHRSAQWLARLISMRRSPWKTSLSSWLTP